MTKYRITYTIAKRVPLKEILVDFDLGAATLEAAARAILYHEFPHLKFRTGDGDGNSAEHVLKQYEITDVKFSPVSP